MRERFSFRSARPSGADSAPQLIPRRRFLRHLHRDERGAVTVETMLIIGAIAIPVLIFLLKFGWPIGNPS